MEGVLYYPYIEVPNNPWLFRTLLYWDEVATIIPKKYAPGRRFTSLTRDLLERELLRTAWPNDGEGQLDEAWLRHLQDLDPSDLARRQQAFRTGHTTELHVEKLFYWPSYYGACQLGLATPVHEARKDRGGDWVAVETRTADEYMAALAMAITHPFSSLARRYADVRWLPATDQPEQLLNLIGSASRFPRSLHELHESRVRLSERERFFQAVVLERLFPVPAEPIIDLDELAAFKQSFGEELRRFRRHVETRVVGILNNPDVDQQVRQVDQLADEFEDEITRAEGFLRQLRIKRITRSTIVQLARHMDPTGIVERVAKGAEDVIGGEGALTGPLAYAAFARLNLFKGQDGRPVATPILELPQHPLVEAFGYNAD